MALVQLKRFISLAQTGSFAQSASAVQLSRVENADGARQDWALRGVLLDRFVASWTTACSPNR